MWDYIMNRWFSGSETIFIARLHVLFGIVVAAAASINLQMIIIPEATPKQMLVAAGIAFAQGLLIEVARRFRATDLET